MPKTNFVQLLAEDKVFSSSGWRQVFSSSGWRQFFSSFCWRQFFFKFWLKTIFLTSCWRQVSFRLYAEDNFFPVLVEDNLFSKSGWRHFLSNSCWRQVSFKLCAEDKLFVDQFFFNCLTKTDFLDSMLMTNLSQLCTGQSSRRTNLQRTKIKMCV